MLFTLNLWNVLAIIAVIALIAFARKKNSVWFGMAGGLLVGLIIAIIYSFKGYGFPWEMLMKAAIVGILKGSLFELYNRFNKK